MKTTKDDKVFEVKGEMRWEGVFTVVAATPEAAEELVRRGQWEDWSPLNLCDWEPLSPPREVEG